MRTLRHPECEAAAGSELMIGVILALRKDFVCRRFFLNVAGAQS